MNYINTIGIANPSNKTDQMAIYDYMVNSIDFSEKERKILRYLYRKSGIESRYSVLNDFSASNGDPRFYNKKNKFNPDIESRLSTYDKHATPLSLEAIKDCMKTTKMEASEITHLICVSCTGMSAPGLDTELISALNLKNNVQRFNINFMGCFAAVNGLKLADTICNADENAKVLLVCVEICTLHFQNKVSEDYNLSNMLFSDGSAAAIITSKPLMENALRIHGFHSDINSDGVGDMSWNISSSGFLMKLSSYVPQLLKLGFKDVLSRILKTYELDYSELDHWAIHPGGKRILDNIEQEFKLDCGELRSSREVLRDFGNMSSPTILFVLKNLQEMEARKRGEYIFTAAFGPGLTTETALLSYA